MRYSFVHLFLSPQTMTTKKRRTPPKRYAGVPVAPGSLVSETRDAIYLRDCNAALNAKLKEIYYTFLWFESRQLFGDGRALFERRRPDMGDLMDQMTNADNEREMENVG